MVLWEVAHGVSAPLSLWRVGVGDSPTPWGTLVIGVGLGEPGWNLKVFFEIWQKTKKIWMENHVVAQIIC